MTLLTADDVLNKKFQATKFREGYEQDEVDEFLDEVVEAMRQLEAENAERHQGKITKKTGQHDGQHLPAPKPLLQHKRILRTDGDNQPARHQKTLKKRIHKNLTKNRKTATLR